MKAHLFVIIFATFLASTTAHAIDVSGAGATFPYPIYAKWADTYKRATGNSVNYQSIGSGGGIQQIKARTVTFGGTDMPLSSADLGQNGLVQFPTVIGGVVPIINIDGFAPGEIAIDGPTLAKIFLGEIKRWNDPAIRGLARENARLPDLPIIVIHRSDGSGTTFLFTNYLSSISPMWKESVGENTAVSWPVGIGARGNEGVANNVAQFKGAIGYVEYAYVKQTRSTFVRMINRAGKIVAPTAGAFQAAAANADWQGTSGFGVLLTNQRGDNSWPISGATFILMHKLPSEPAKAGEALKFFAWAYANGAQMAADLDYVPMPKEVVDAIQNMWSREIQLR